MHEQEKVAAANSFMYAYLMMLEIIDDYAEYKNHYHDEEIKSICV